MFCPFIERLKRKPAWATEETDLVKGVFDGRDTMLYCKSLVERNELMLEFFRFLPLFGEG